MARSIRYIFVFTFLIVSDCFAQSWSPPKTINSLPAISFSFRISEITEKPGMHGAEWVFKNNSDTLITFVYRLISDAGDTLVGYTAIEGKRNEFSGWLIRGEQFVKTEGSNVSPADR